ncbi:MAG: peptide ABC transporter substrate-binding protein [Patescibacteria group bacterium]
MNSLDNKKIQTSSQAKKPSANAFNSFKAFLKHKLKLNKSNGLNGKQTELDKKLIYSLAKSKIPSLKQLKHINKFLNKREQRIIQISLLIIFISFSFLGWRFYNNNLQVIPATGGEYISGLVGTPKYINPLYAMASDVDSDISQLIYSSIFKRGLNGELVNDLATNYTISEDSKIYTVNIKENIKWHNGETFSVDDIIFTFNAIKDKQYNSPLRSSFKGVEIHKVDEQTINFVLAEPYAAFLQLLTFGIIPSHLWSLIAPDSASLAELNLKPIGAGPYKFKSLVKDKAGNIRAYNLIANEYYYNKKPYIENIVFKLFVNFEEAIISLNGNQIDGLSYLPNQSKDKLIALDSLSLYKLNLPQITSIFFNQKNNSLLENKSIRQALALAINKNEILTDVFPDDIHLIDGPILPNNFAYYNEIKKYKFDQTEANKLLDQTSWVRVEISPTEIEEIQAEQTNEEVSEEEEASASENNDKEAEEKIINDKLLLGPGSWRKKGNDYFIIYLTTVETEENIKVAEVIKKYWEEVGVKTIVNIMPINQIQTEVIRSRNFQALLYSQVVGNDPDTYVFWHSSQIGEGGLNIANYTNKEVDQLLEDARLTSNIEVRTEKYKKFQEIIAEDLPVIFLYSPTYTYVQSKKIKGFGVNNILVPRDRFANITDWYIKTGKKLIWQKEE